MTPTTTSSATPHRAQQIEALHHDEHTNVVNGTYWRLKVPVGGDMKLLSAMMGLCGCSSEWPCMFCKSSTKTLCMHKKEWVDNLPLRTSEEHLKMQHIPTDAPYLCLSRHCKAKIVLGALPPDVSIMNDNKRRAEQRKQFGGRCTRSVAFHTHPSSRLHHRCPQLDFACRFTFVSAYHSTRP